MSSSFRSAPKRSRRVMEEEKDEVVKHVRSQYPCSNEIVMAIDGYVPPPTIRCHVCCTIASYARCAFCERQTCQSCARNCEHCNGIFCHLCTITDYSTKFERLFCPGCIPTR